MEKGFSFSQVITFSLVLFIVFIAGAGSLWLYQNNPTKKSPDLLPTASLQPSPTTQILPTVEPTLTSSPSLTPKPDSTGIKTAMAKKYNKSEADVNITVSKIDATHAWGTVSFAGEMGGGWFLAYRNPDGWIIIDDGNGTISCEKIAPYNFPVDMVPECVDKNGSLIKR